MPEILGAINIANAIKLIVYPCQTAGRRTHVGWIATRATGMPLAGVWCDVGVDAQGVFVEKGMD